MELSEVQKGDVIRYTAVLTADAVDTYGADKIISEGGYYWFLNRKGADISFELVERPVKHPTNWPPKLGDTWEAEGQEYYARKNTFLIDKVVLARFDNDGRNYEEGVTGHMEAFLKMNPVCLRRRNK